MSVYAKVPTELQLAKQWLCWKSIERDGKKTKMPVQVDGKPASSTDPATWSSFRDAAQAANLYAGVGFVFSESDCYIGIDLDGCRNPETGKLDQWARDIVLQFATYTEVSPSGTGVKLFGSTGCRWPHRNKIDLELPATYGKNPGVEVYDAGRFFCVTGQRLQGAEQVMPVDEHFDWLADKIKMRQEYAPVVADGVKMETPVLERAAKYLEKLEPSISGQSGHNKAFHAACCLVMGFGLSESEAYTLLARDFNPRCDPPWSEQELRHKVKSANAQPGARNFLRDARPEQWSKVRLPGSYRESRPSEQDEPEQTELRRTTLADAAKLYLSELASGNTHLIDTGIPDLDYAIGGGVSPGEMVIIAARPSHGKSAVALQMAHQMSADGLPVALVSEEMSALALGKRAIQYAATTPEEHWRTSLDDVGSQVEAHFSVRKDIHIVESCGTVDRACEQIERYVTEDGVKVAMVDYAQLLTAKGANRYESISKVSQQLRMLASRLQIVVVVLAQLNRAIENRTKFVPQMSDIKETGQLEQDADVILFGVWPHRIDSTQDKKVYQFFVGKNRNRAINSSSFNCEFDPARQKLLEESAESMPNYDPALAYTELPE